MQIVFFRVKSRRWAFQSAASSISKLVKSVFSICYSREDHMGMRLVGLQSQVLGGRKKEDARRCKLASDCMLVFLR